jgi:hypothetical protein
MTEGSDIQVREHEPDLHASHEDFRTIFNENLKEDYRLSFLLTGDSQRPSYAL